MIFLTCLLACFGVFWIGMRRFRQRALPAQIDSLRVGRAHHLAAGVLFGSIMPEGAAPDVFFLLQNGVIGLSLVWFGVQTGLSLDFQRLRRLPGSGLLAQASCALVTGGFAVLAALAGGRILTEHLGLIHNLGLAVLLLTAFALSARFPEPAFRWHGKLRPITADLTPTLQFGNCAGLLLIAIAFPFFAQTVSVTLGPLTFAGHSRVFALLCGLGLLGGIAMDFVLRAYRSIAQSIALAFAIMAALAGLCSVLGLPGISVGFLAGVWLVNATVVKRAVQEQITRAAGVIEPLFFFALGTMVTGAMAQPFFHPIALVPFALVLLLVRSMGRTLGLSATRHLWQTPKAWDTLIELSLRPLGNLSAAIAAQFLLVLEFSHHTLVVGLFLAIFVSQTALPPPPRSEGKRGLTTLSSRD